MRFETQAAILLHEQCHSLNNNEIRCPKCEIDTTSTSVGATVTATGAPVPAMATNVSSSVNDGESMMMVTASTKTTSSRNWNWNTLHTHLWREHNIDMELYSCPHCPFKTPILSRLKNTHLKIHSDLRGIPFFTLGIPFYHFYLAFYSKDRIFEFLSISNANLMMFFFIQLV